MSVAIIANSKNHCVVAALLPLLGPVAVFLVRVPKAESNTFSSFTSFEEADYLSSAQNAMLPQILIRLRYALMVHLFIELLEKFQLNDPIIRFAYTCKLYLSSGGRMFEELIDLIGVEYFVDAIL